MNEKLLISMAVGAMENAYCPYSNFSVGTALLTKKGKIFLGSNIENSSFSATNCAERTAFFKAISEGEKDFEAIAVVGGLKGKISDFTYPCGICRQVMSEFCGKDFKIIVAKSEKDFRVHTISELFPFPFTSKSLK